MGFDMEHGSGLWARLVATSLFAGIALGCGSGSQPTASRDRVGDVPDGGVLDDTDSGLASTEGMQERGACATPAVPEGELQNRASGPSVFGIVVGGDPGLFDALGGSECGVPGVRICLLDTETCTTSDAAGQYVLDGLPEGEDLAISFEKAGHPPALRLASMGSTPINLRQTRIMPTEGGMALRAEHGLEQAPTNGSLVVTALGPGEGTGSVVLQEDVVISLLPGGTRPIYSRGAIGADGLSSDELDPDLEATQFGGWGLFFNVEPGEYAVRFERQGRLCDQPLPGFGHGVDEEGNIRIRILAGYQTTGVAAFCQ